MGFIRNINVIHKIVLVSALMFSFYASQASAVWISVSNNSDLPLTFYAGANHGSANLGSGVTMPAHNYKDLFAFDIGINNGTATFAAVSPTAATPAQHGQYNVPALRFFLYVTPTARQAASVSETQQWIDKGVGAVTGVSVAIGTTVGTDGAAGFAAPVAGTAAGVGATYDAQQINQKIDGGMHHVIGTYAVQVLNAPPGVKVGVYYRGGHHVVVCISNQNGQFYQFCPNPQSVWPNAFISDSD